MQSFKAEFDQRGVTIVVISFAEPEKLVGYQKVHNWPFLLLADPDRIAYQAFTLKRLSWLSVFSPSTLWLYVKSLRAGKTREDYGREDIYQAGGDFIIDRAGAILFAHRSRDPADRPAAATLMREIDRVQRITGERTGS